jgi:drug/metabolite transporter (DMT)-like permease
VSVLGLTLTVVAAAGWAGLDVSRKVLVGRMEAVPVLFWLVAGQLVVFTVLAVQGGAWIEDPMPYAGYAAASIGLNVAANLLFLHAVRVSPISVMIPLLSFVPVFTVAAANPLLGEMPSARQLVGIAIVVLGALALGGGDDGETRRGPLAMLRAIIREPGSLPMLGTALFWAMTMVVDKLAIGHAPISAHAVVLNAGMAVCLLLWLAARREIAKLGQVRSAWGVLGAAILAGSTGLGAQLMAVKLLHAGVVETIKRAIGIVAAVVVGRLAFDEALSRAKIVSIVLMIVGTALIVV